ncbi:hypothetical protein AC396_001728 [Salmonella enterica subsp. enterica]|nr:hypothetical protein [Salmonella enterica subsp. enterica serovar Aba]EGI5268603.1 hypothetical protein [Salmonella enterica subsp. enterica serovar Canada]
MLLICFTLSRSKGILSQNNCSSLVMCFGATALIPAIFHFSCDLFQRHSQERHYCRIKS